MAPNSNSAGHADHGGENGDIEPYLMTILSKKFEAITRDMTQSLLKSARSGVINSARDFSSAITLFDGRQVMIDEGLPAHLGNIQLIPEYTTDHFDEIERGDCFLTNSPYAGNSHHGDYTIHCPVFHGGDPLFWSINKAHQADVGAADPSAYLPEAETIYQEGPHFPSLRIQEDYTDKDDVVRFLKHNLRLGEEQWYGDYKAQVAAVRTGETELESLVDEYGVDTIRNFIDAWFDYGDRMMRREIEKLPETEISRTGHHDPIHNAPEGVPVTVAVSIDPDGGEITVDLSDNIENIPSGYNLCEATVVAAAYSIVFNNLDPNIPHNQGSISRINVELEEGNLVGKPEYPMGTALATSNVCDLLFNVGQAAFAELGEPFGVAEGNFGLKPHVAVIAGTDYRRDDKPFINQLIFSEGGGPAVHGHDGWLTYSIGPAAGVIYRDSIEIDEQKFPILFKRDEIIQNSAGAGQWRGSPGTVIEYESRADEIQLSYVGAAGPGYEPDGVLGGHQANPSRVIRRTDDGEEEMPLTNVPGTLEPGEVIVSELSGGGGYGDPTDRDPERVRDDVAAGVTSAERAREVYGVVVDTEGAEITIDWDQTDDRRARMQGGDE